MRPSKNGTNPSCAVGRNAVCDALGEDYPFGPREQNILIEEHVVLDAGRDMAAVALVLNRELLVFRLLP